MTTNQGHAAPQTGRFGPSSSFSWDILVDRARRLADRPHAPPAPAAEAAADFDEASRRAFGPAERLAGFVRLMPVTRLAPAPVGIHLVENGSARPLRTTEGLFPGGARTEAAGFRILDAGLASDWVSYLGASYFRAAGSRDQYGLSARGIAVDTGIDGREEFPAFTDFWIEAISPQRFLIHALLDGPSLTGAFAFDCTHSALGVVQQVRASLFLRRDIERLGFAPATSLFWYGEADRRRATDWRPEIHDSDGLAIWSGTGERIWRPLINPDRPRASIFRADGVKGFGLLQRDQTFANYQDDGAFYDRRPSLWVEPVGDWGAGSVFLYEFPTINETVDNIVAFWISERAARAGERRDIAYRLHWTSDDLSDGGAARVVDLWTGAAGIPGLPAVAGARKYVIDFTGPGLVGLDRSSGVEAVVNLSAPTLMAVAAYPIAHLSNRWRVMLDIRDDTGNPKELRVFLRRGDSALSETLIQPLTP